MIDIGTTQPISHGELFIWECAAGSLQWRHKERDGVSNYQHIECLFNRLFMCRSNKTTKFRVTGHCEGNPAVTWGFPSPRASNAENILIWWRQHVQPLQIMLVFPILCLHYFLRNQYNGVNDSGEITLWQSSSYCYGLHCLEEKWIYIFWFTDRKNFPYLIVKRTNCSYSWRCTIGRNSSLFLCSRYSTVTVSKSGTLLILSQ